MAFDMLGVDSLLQVLSFTNVQGLARMSCASRLGAVAAHEAQQKPSLVVLKGTPHQVAQDLRQALPAKPTLAFMQYCGREPRGAEMLNFVQRNLPASTRLLGAHTNSLQCAVLPNCPKPCAGKPPAKGTTLEVSGRRDHEQIALLLATLPEATAHPFHVRHCSRHYPDSDEDSYDSDEEDEQQCEQDSDEEDEQQCEQDEGVEAAANREALGQDSEDASAGLEKHGGAESWLDSLGAPDDVQASSQQLQQPQRVAQQTDELAELLALSPTPQVIVIHLAGGGYGLVKKIQQAFPQAAVIGGVVEGDEVVVKTDSKGSVGRGVGVMAITGNAPLFAMTSPFVGNVRAAEQDVQRKLRRAQELAAADERRLLGALLFTCNGRGREMFGREANDAALFQAQFPMAPMMGYYAGGEIGPAIDEDAPEDEQNAFLRGNAQLQGFTAVFGFFLVPHKHAPSLQFQRAVLYGEVQQAFQELRAA